MIRKVDVDNVRRLALTHVALCAIRIRLVIRDSRCEGVGFVATQASTVIVLPIRLLQRLVWIVTRRTDHCASGSFKALAHQHPLTVTGDPKISRRVRGRHIDGSQVRQPHSRPEICFCSTRPQNGHGPLQVTLHAHIDLPGQRQIGRIHDRSIANLTPRLSGTLLVS